MTRRCTCPRIPISVPTASSSRRRSIDSRLLKVTDPLASLRRSFTRGVLRWGRENLRDFYWRRRRLSPYRVLVIEVLLARTRAAAVEPVARALLSAYPRPQALARARVVDLARRCRALGLHRKRGRGLKALGDVIVREHGGRVPRRDEELLSLPLVGRYAVQATQNVAFGQRRAIVDANVARVLCRCFALATPPGRLDAAEGLWRLAAELLPQRDSRIYNWALLDLGALVCKPRSPRCEDCPLSPRCKERIAAAHS